ncbi:class I SAM-dependent methyltransferase [Metabacillus litoralis]|uniref:class I SAM-dependent methyltransferase n=1 Tax=Metabacillus litoralis TaxID=152268 RepID=UPI0020415BCF|nr:class I SAM-dependent methyltransferase [Metabacillus litoralis]MCM3410149.1 class I SAM-dependent methyltransferase [Metabacillus litoralis]
MKLSEKELLDLFYKIDNSFVGGEEENIKYQSKYINAFPKNGHVLDLGCGKGAFLNLLRNNRFTCTGIDMDEKNINHCLERGLNVFKEDAFNHLDNYPHSYDGIFMAHMIEHYPALDAVKLLVLCFESLKENGTLVIITPNFSVNQVHESNFWLSSTHIRPYPLQWLNNALTLIGFTVTNMGYDQDSPLLDTAIIASKISN